MDGEVHMIDPWECGGLRNLDRVEILMACNRSMEQWQFILELSRLAFSMARRLDLVEGGDGDLTTEGHGMARKEDPPGPPVVAPRAIAGGTVEENGGLESPLSIGEDGMDPQVDTPPAPPQAGGVSTFLSGR